MNYLDACTRGIETKNEDDVSIGGIKPLAVALRLNEKQIL